MSAIGEAERRTQERIVKLFIDALHYAYLGNFSEGDHENIIPSELEQFLAMWQGYAEREEEGDLLVRRAVDEVVKVASNTSLSPYDRNRAVYNLLRYGVNGVAPVWWTPRKARKRAME